MRLVHVPCLLALVVSAILVAPSAHEAAAETMNQSAAKHRKVKHRVRVRNPGNASVRHGGSWKKLKAGQYLADNDIIVTYGLSIVLFEGDAGQVTVTVYPHSEILVNNFDEITLDSMDMHPDTEVTVDENLVDSRHKPAILFLSSFRVLSRLVNLTLGGHGTSYSVRQHFNGKVLDGMDVWENDPFGSKNKVESFIYPGTAPVGTIYANEHKWVDADGHVH